MVEERCGTWLSFLDFCVQLVSPSLESNWILPDNMV